MVESVNSLLCLKKDYHSFHCFRIENGINQASQKVLSVFVGGGCTLTFVVQAEQKRF